MTRRWISAGAFVDFGDAGVAVVALDGVFAAVAVAAVDLDGFVVTRVAVLLEKSLAMAPSMLKRAPRSK